MRLILRYAVGLALFAGGLTFLGYGIAQAVENGSCGTSSSGRSVGPPCPSGMGPMIVLMVLGAFVAFAGSSLATSSRSGIPGFAILGGMLRFFGATVIVVVAAIVLGIVDVNEDDTRPGREIIVVVMASVLFLTIPPLLRGRKASGPSLAQPAAAVAGLSGLPTTPPETPWRPATPPPETPWRPAAEKQEVAKRVQELQGLREAGLLDEDEYSKRLKQILADL